MLNSCLNVTTDRWEIFVSQVNNSYGPHKKVSSWGIALGGAGLETGLCPDGLGNRNMNSALDLLSTKMLLGLPRGHMNSPRPGAQQGGLGWDQDAKPAVYPWWQNTARSQKETEKSRGSRLESQKGDLGGENWGRNTGVRRSSNLKKEADWYGRKQNYWVRKKCT